MQNSKIEVDKNLKEVVNKGSSDFPVYIDEYYLNSGDYLRWHWHKEIQTSFVSHGQICFHVDGEEILLNQNEGIIFNSNILHQINPYNNDCQMYSVMFDDSIISGSEQSIIGKKYVDTVINSNNLNYIVLNRDIAWQRDILKYVEEIHSVYNEKEYAYELELANNLNRIWLILIKNLQHQIEKSNKKTSHDEERVKIAINYIKDNYMNEITLDDIANSCNISKSECCRSFKRIIKITPFEYLMKHRVLKATEYLYNTDESISNICVNVGFNGISYFGKIFKKYMNCTPSQYKANIKERNIPSIK